MHQPLPRAFYDRSTPLVAQELIGKILVRQIGDQMITGKIVETEAYLGVGDGAAHGAFGRTKRTAILFGEAGLAYIYQLRAYYLLNVVTEAEGMPSAVLLRALEPLEGTEFVQHLLGTPAVKTTQLMNGPGKLCRALQLNTSHTGVDFSALESPFYIVPGADEAVETVTSTRIGITKSANLPYRFTLKGSRFVSKPPIP